MTEQALREYESLAEFAPDWISAPGETVADLLEERGWSQADFATRTGFTKKHVHLLLRGKVQISEGVALKLEQMLGSSSRFWMKLETQYWEWQEMGMCTRVIFRSNLDVAASEPGNDLVNVPVNVPANEGVNEGVTGYALNERQRWFLQQLQLGHRVSPDEIAQHWKKSVATVERDIAGLRKQNLIDFVGAPKTGHYRIKPQQVEG